VKAALFNFAESEDYKIWVFPLQGNLQLIVLGENAGSPEEKTVSIIVNEEQFREIKETVSDLGELV